jgi:hypothetical protein
MKAMVVAALAWLPLSGIAQAADCAAPAAEKKLPSAARESFMKKCEKDHRPKK